MTGSVAAAVRAAGAVTASELRRLFRDRTALFFILVLPVVIVVIIGTTVFGQIESDVTVGVVVDDDAPVGARGALAALRGAEGVDVDELDDRDALVRSIRLGERAAGIVVSDAETSDRIRLELIAVPSAGGAETVRSRLVGAVESRSEILAARDVAVSMGLDADAAVTAAEALAEAVPRVDVEVELTSEGTADTNQFSYTSAANLVLFVFINSLAGGASLAQVRDLGILRRALTAPVTPSMLVLGLATSRLALALVQSVLLVAAGVVLFGVSFGDPVAAAALIVVFAVLSSAAGMLVGALARSADAAQAMSIPVALGMAMLGGCMWPLEIVGDTMRTIGHAVPHAWAMDAWVELVFDGRGLRAVLGELAVLTCFAVAAVTVGTWRLARTVTS